jgi:hypothetical protein
MGTISVISQGLGTLLGILEIGSIILGGVLIGIVGIKISNYYDKKREAKEAQEAEYERLHPKPRELTSEEKREKTLKENIGKHIVLYKAKTVQTVTERHPVFDYTNDISSTRYVSYYDDVAKNVVTSAETIEGTLTDADTYNVKVDDKWYRFGIEPEKIYELNIIREEELVLEDKI